MSDIKLKSITLQNFKGCKSRTINFGDSITEISGQNASGKSTILDGFLWVLFGKDSSGNTNFGIRPVDETGKEIDNIEISAEIVLNVSGKNIAFKKTQKQKWTKHRGSATPAYEGNVNVYEVDGFPQNEKEYKAKIAEIISEENFKLIADLRYFSNLEWKKKKELLLNLCGDLSDEDVITSDPEHWSPIADDVLAAGAEKAKDKAKKDLRELNKVQKELPVRIDEISKQLRDVPDASALGAEKKNLESELEVKTAEYDKVKADSSEAELRKRQMEIQNRINEIVQAETSKIRAEKEALYKVYAEKKSAYSNLEDKAELIRREITRKDSLIKDLQTVLYDEGKKYKEIQSRELDANATVCKCCGQILPREQIDKINKDFLDRKKADAEASKKRGWDIKNSIIKHDAERQKLVNDEANLAEKVLIAKSDFDSAKKEYDSFNDNTNIENSEVNALRNELETLISKINSAKDTKEKLYSMSLEVTGLKGKINAINQQIADIEATKKTNIEIQNRIEELQEEQRDNGQKIAFTEQKVILLEEFSIKKAEMLSQKITSCFELTNFSLFNRQINGSILEECEITLKGVKYKDMNSGHRIVCAMDIIRTFSEKIGVTAPLFIDNAESVNDFNLPKMNCQLVLLKVTDDPELVVKVA